MSILTQTQLQVELAYDPLTGIFCWKRPRQGRQINKPAGTLRSDGYLQIRIWGRIYLLHKLAWLYVYAEYPPEVDHKNRNRADNTINNLRKATRTQNNINSKIREDNTSGFKGVFFHKETGKWRAMINVDGKRESLGLFVTAEAAGAAYAKARSAVYGEFVPCQ